MIVGKNSKKLGECPAIILINPKYDHNVAAALRACSCFGIKQLWWTGNRVNIDPEKKRLPREERMKGYKDVELINFDYPFDQFKHVTPVAIELLPNSENLADFEHPEHAVYVFGPEDGTIPSVVRQHCHRFVTIPTRHCTNLSAAAYIVLYDRIIKRYQSCLEDLPVLTEQRGWADNSHLEDLL